MKLLIIGHGRHGKDTVAEILRDNYGFSFISSSYFAGEKVVRPALAACGITYDSMEKCYEDRANWRAFWYEAISAYNKGGRSRLAEEILVDYDMYVGMRSARELEASLELFDHILWVDARGRAPLEPRSSFDIDFDRLRMHRVDNHKDLAALKQEVARVVRYLGLA
jgi:hypothetical protein